MSEVLRPYLVELAQVQSAFGAKDPALLDAILSSQASHIADYEKQSRFQLKDQVTRNRLLDFINGSIFPSGYAYLYGYCLELVCGHFGELTRMPEFEDFHWPFVDKVRDLEASVGRRKPKPRPIEKEPALLNIKVDSSGITVTCSNVAFHQVQACVAAISNQGEIVDTENNWKVAGTFTGPDYLSIIRDVLASIDLEPIVQETVYGCIMVIRNIGASINSYRLKGLDFEARRYPVPIPQYAEYPKVSYLALEEFGPELNALKNPQFSSREEIINEGRKAYGSLLMRATAASRDIVFFV
jgi:hypothetical protein